MRGRWWKEEISLGQSHNLPSQLSETKARVLQWWDRPWAHLDHSSICCSENNDKLETVGEQGALPQPAPPCTPAGLRLALCVVLPSCGSSPGSQLCILVSIAGVFSWNTLVLPGGEWRSTLCSEGPRHPHLASWMQPPLSVSPRPSQGPSSDRDSLRLPPVNDCVVKRCLGIRWLGRSVCVHSW